MKKQRHPGPQAESLRRRAEERLAKRKAEGSGRADADPRQLLHELEVHQIELEMQNEELRSARQEIEAGLKRYTELFDFAPISYFVLGRDGAIRGANLAGARLFGLERQRLVGRHFSQFVAGTALRGWDLFLVRVLTGDPGEQRSEACDLEIEGAGSQELAVHLTAVALDGPEPTALVAVEDVTGRKHAEAEVREEGRHKDEFLATLSHELRNPLAPIRNSLFVLQHAAPGGEQARKAQAIIDRQVKHLTRIVDDLLDVTRIARGKILLQKERIELGDLVRRTMDDHRAGFEENGIQLEAHFPPELFWIEADETRIVQVLGNLLGNAAKFTLRGGKVELSLRREGEQVALSVRDTGMGIAPEMRGHLFEPFRQAPQTLERSRGGLGLGLAMVKGIVELHHGTVDVASGGIGQGSDFTVRMPLAAPVPAQEPVAPRAGRHRRVLVVEDNRDAAESLREALELNGHVVKAVYDGPAALAEAREFQPEVILCDIGLPGMDGYELARALRAQDASRGAYLVALTGYALPEDLQRATEAGFDAHVAKPPSLDKLEQLLADAPAGAAGTADTLH